MPPGVRITAPNGATVNDASGISALLGREVKLVAVGPVAGANLLVEYIDVSEESEPILDFPAAGDAPAGSFFDYAVLHLVTTATLTCLSELYPEGRFHPRRFRPNLLIECNGAEPFPENAWVGKTLAIGDEVRIAISDPCPRCVMTTLPQGGLPADRGILKTVAHNRVHVPFMSKSAPSAGVYARVVRGGRIRAGDSVRLA